jgi:hypothetical protein
MGHMVVCPKKKKESRVYITSSLFIAGHLLTAVINSLAYVHDWGLAFDHVLFLKQVRTDIKKNDNIATALDIVLGLLGNPVTVYPSITEMGFFFSGSPLIKRRSLASLAK